MPYRLLQSGIPGVSGDKGYHNNQTLTELDAIGVRSYIAEPNRGRRQPSVGSSLKRTDGLVRSAARSTASAAPGRELASMFVSRALKFWDGSNTRFGASATAPGAAGVRVRENYVRVTRARGRGDRRWTVLTLPSLLRSDTGRPVVGSHDNVVRLSRVILRG
jgi:hypothetical protein